MEFRMVFLGSGTKILLGKDAESNEQLVKNFTGMSNKMLHTSSPGSPFCVIEAKKPSKKEISEAGIFCAKYSQDWRNNKKDVIVNVFTGKDVYKSKGMKVGTWGVRKSSSIRIKKGDILELEGSMIKK